MFKIANLMRAAAVGAFALTGSLATSAQAALIDLGFSLDASSSVNTANFNIARAALANALSVIPTSGPNQYRVAVSTFATGFVEIVAPTILTAANVAAVQASVAAAVRTGGGTNTAGAITAMAAQFSSLPGGFGATTLLNITTDGSPNNQSAAVDAAVAAVAAGVDGISFEAVDNPSDTTLNNMLAIARPLPSVLVTDLAAIPNATLSGFVIPVSTFEGYSAAITAKIGRIVDDTGGGTPVIPLPAGLPLLLTGLAIFGGLRARRRAAA